ncbi:MAG: hypothetical protein P9E24_13230 [Candidatus Competibacter sp.]|nr:hypothetical protein [Candidatus Competibacter sp.]MDG4582716.1 hypothetical protein [Candidatus Competibacter sp.]
MINRKMKQLALAVGVALGGMGLLPSAEAVSVSADNLGQVLIFPYYTVRGGWNTLLGVTNTSDRVVAVKVRFHEALNSRDVFDFNIILSPWDIWTGWLAEGGNGPVLSTTDLSCTVGAIPAGGQPFTTTAYTASGTDDGGPTTVDRLREGYVEMIMMGAAVANTTNPLAAGAIHKNGAAPTGCGALTAAFTSPTGLPSLQAAFPEYIPSPLKGTFALVNASPGKGFNAVGLPTALNNFRTTPFMTLQLPPSGNVPFTSSGYEPTLAAATTTGVYYNASTDLPVPGAPSGAAAVSSALSVSSVLNEWSRRDNPGAGWSTLTDWVVTFPTKAFYADQNTSVYGGWGPPGQRQGLPQGVAPFTETFTEGQSCDQVNLRIYDREEQPAPISAFSPWVTPQLCYEANVLTFNQGALLASPNASSISYPTSFLFGWMSIDFTTPLPAIGFAITSRDSGNALLSEAALYDHSYIRPIR